MGMKNFAPRGFVPLSPEETTIVFGRDQAELEKRLAAGKLALVVVSPDGFVMELNTSNLGRRRPEQEKPKQCIEHLWRFDADNFKRRSCSRPGCVVRQVFEWRPEDPEKQGQWVNEAAKKIEPRNTQKQTRPRGRVRSNSQ